MGFFACVSRHNSWTQSFQANPHKFFWRSHAYSSIFHSWSEMWLTRDTDRPNYSNPCCACAPRVNIKHFSVRNPCCRFYNARAYSPSTSPKQHLWKLSQLWFSFLILPQSIQTAQKYLPLLSLVTSLPSYLMPIWASPLQNLNLPSIYV